MSVYQRANGGACHLCSKPRPAGRTRFCSDECWAEAKAQRGQARQELRRAACQRCGGEKGPGPRGKRYCEPCALVVADTFTQLEHERARRKSVAQNQSRVANGERLSRRIVEAPEGTKWCARCQEFKPLPSFAVRGDRRAAAYCKPCQRFYNSERRLKIEFGISWEDYELLLACQDFRCAICAGRPRKYLLSVDHDHKTGEIRGLLCSRCNHRLLGSANDDAARLRKAADYLERFAPREVFGARRYVPGFAPAPEVD